MNQSSSPGALFRARLQSGIVTMPGVFNAVTAKLAAREGFDALYLSGAGVTNSLTGYPDIALLTLTEMAQQARYVADATPLPIIADADTGYGEILNVARAVREFEHAGLAGIHLEDQVAPKRCGHLDGKQVIDASDMVKKIKAAVKARQDQDFFLIARTDARSIHGLDDAVDRANRYMDAGADAIFPESLQSREEFAAFARRVNAPLLANMTEFGKTPYLSVPEFEELGYAMVIFPMSAFRIMMKSAETLYRTIRSDGQVTDLLDQMQTRAELYDVIDYAGYTKFDQDVAEESSHEQHE